MAKQNNTFKDQIIAFYNDALFQKLNAYYSKTTLFNILKIERNENRHSAFLAWLLDIKGSHGLGEEPLKRFMRLLANRDSEFETPFLNGNYKIESMTVELEQHAEFEKKKGRIDILIDFSYSYKSNSNFIDKKTLVIIENKIYTEEHDKQTNTYYDWALQQAKYKNHCIVGVFLSPEKNAKCACEQFIKITYDDILRHVIDSLPFKKISPSDACVLIDDYVINLGQSIKKTKKDGTLYEDKDTVLALSDSIKEKTYGLYEKHGMLLDAVIFVKNKGRGKLLKEFYKDRYESCLDFNSLDESRLLSFWDANEPLLKLVLSSSLQKLNDDLETINSLLGMHKTNRDNTKYLVYAKNCNSPINTKPVPKSLASYFIFKAWLENNEDATIDEIRKAFPVESIFQDEKYPYQYLFYWCNDIDKARKQGPADNATYYKASIDEKTDGKKYLQWDFYGCDTLYYLKINKEGANKKEKVLSMKMWLKDEFDRLVAYAEEQHGILVKE